MDEVPSGPSGVSYSEISPTVDMDTVTYAALGAGAIGTVLYGIYAASGSEDDNRYNMCIFLLKMQNPS